MDINNNEMLGKFICNSLDDTRGIASKMYNNYQKNFCYLNNIFLNK